jgi:hypothetical protein
VNRRLASHPSPWIVLAGCLLAAVAYWYWALEIYAPDCAARLVTSGLHGNNSDLYPRWLGSRELLLHGRDPYSKDVTRDIQIGFYGRALDPAKKSDPIQQESFVYPVYTVFLFAPTIYLPFSVVQEASSILFPLAIAFSVPLWMGGLGLRPRPLIAISAMLLAVSSPPSVMEFSMQNLTAMTVFFLAAAAAAVARRWLISAGILLALSTMKPDILVIIVPWFLFWAAARWRERSRLLWSFTVTLTLLVAGAEALSPGWPWRFLAALREYPSYGADPSILQVLLPALLAKLCIATLLISLMAVCWRWRNSDPGSEGYGWSLVCVCIVTLAVIPKLAAYNGILLLPGVIWLAAHYQKIRTLRLFPRALTKATFACILWSWPSAAAMDLSAILFSTRWTYARAFIPAYTWLALTPFTLITVVSITIALRGGEFQPTVPRTVDVATS